MVLPFPRILGVCRDEIDERAIPASGGELFHEDSHERGQIQLGEPSDCRRLQRGHDVFVPEYRFRLRPSQGKTVSDPARVLGHRQPDTDATSHV
jgi:hypothetical protein